MTRQNVLVRTGFVAVLVAVLSLGLVGTAAAHESREVGDFEFVVGFVNEPAYVNELNGIQLNISQAAAEGEEGEPVLNAHQSLDATILYGEDSIDVELRPVFGEDGAYTAEVIPTETGTYSFQFTGEIEGEQIDETFRGGPDTFSEVEPREELEFPAGDSASVDDSDQAAAFGIAGVVAGLLGLGAGAAAYYKVSSNSGQQRRPAQRQQQTE